MSTLGGPGQPLTAGVYSSKSSPSTPSSARPSLQVSDDGWWSPLRPAGDGARGVSTQSPLIATIAEETAARPGELPTAKVELPDSFDPFGTPKSPDTSQRMPRPALRRTDSTRYDWAAVSYPPSGEKAATSDRQVPAWINRPFDPVVGSRNQPSGPRTEYLTPPPSTRKPLNPSAMPFVQGNAFPSSPRSVPQIGRSGANFVSTPASWTWPRQSGTGATESGGQRASRKELVSVYEDAERSTPTRTGGTPVYLAATPENTPPRILQETLATRYVYLQNLLPSLNEEGLGALVQSQFAGLSLRGSFTGHLASLGHAVLVFSDVRDSLFALQVIELDLDFSATLFSSAQALARCITPQAFEQLAGSAEQNPLISSSEGVVVATIRGPQSAVSPTTTFATFGEIRSFKSVDRMTYVVEYWDDRAAEVALRQLSGRSVAAVRFECTFEPSIATSHVASSKTSTKVEESAPLERCGGSSVPLSPPDRAEVQASLLEPAPRLVTYEEPSMTPTAARRAPTTRVLGANASARLETTARSHARATPERNPSFDAQSESSSVRTGRGGSRLPAEYGLVRDDKIPLGNMINFARIEQGLDSRTTLMIKNIPNKLKDMDVMAYIDEVVGRAYDFFYLRCDYSNDCNVGYGFVNFVSTAALLDFARARLGTRWNMCGSDKLCVLSYANIQGKSALIRHFKNSSVLDQNENRRPKLFVTSGPNAGRPEPFPACDDPIRKARSAMNASNVGLFPSSKPVFKIAHALAFGSETRSPA